MAFPLTTTEADAILERINAQEELIVAAGVQTGDGAIIFHPIPNRHDSSINWCYKHKIPRATGPNPRHGFIDGFITNKGRFVDRAEAGRIVLAAKQGTPMDNTAGRNPHGMLFSEDMWLCEYTDPRFNKGLKPEEIF